MRWCYLLQRWRTRPAGIHTEERYSRMLEYFESRHRIIRGSFGTQPEIRKKWLDFKEYKKQQNEGGCIGTVWSSTNFTFSFQVILRGKNRMLREVLKDSMPCCCLHVETNRLLDLFCTKYERFSEILVVGFSKRFEYEWFLAGFWYQVTLLCEF